MPSLRVDTRLCVDLAETSDVTLLPRGRFFVVGDKKTHAVVVAPDGSSAEAELPGVGGGKSGFEACAFDGASGLYVFSEERQTLFTYRWSSEVGETPALEAERGLTFGARKNKGVEGMVHLDAASSPTGEPGLLLANEGAPRAVFFLGERQAAPIEIALDPAILDVCADFSGLARDPRSGAILVVSDESSALVAMTLERPAEGPRLSVTGAWDLMDASGRALERVEGVVVDPHGKTWVLLEDERVLCRVG
jgi:uncharacterized protein YjiK